MESHPQTPEFRNNPQSLHPCMHKSKVKILLLDKLMHFNVCLFVLLLYVPSQQLWSWRDGQFT